MKPIPDDETGSAIQRWASQGSDLAKPMMIDFFIIVPTEEKGIYVTQLKELKDYKVTIEHDEESGIWTCYCSKEMIPRYSDLVMTESLMETIADLVGGEFDGFASYGNAPWR